MYIYKVAKSGYKIFYVSQIHWHLFQKMLQKNACQYSWNFNLYIVKMKSQEKSYLEVISTPFSPFSITFLTTKNKEFSKTFKHQMCTLQSSTSNSNKSLNAQNQ